MEKSSAISRQPKRYLKQTKSYFDVLKKRQWRLNPHGVEAAKSIVILIEHDARRAEGSRARSRHHDTIGVSVVPLDKAEEILTLAAEQAERERKTREWVAKGKTVEGLLAEFGRI